MVAEVGSIIRDINERGISILLVEQNARMALKLAHRAYALETGTVVLQGSAAKMASDDRVRQAYLGGGVRWCCL
jgi:branched-chain amino acid transport system ATP-binding protein